jgi:predicted GNAT superfamily acetyltransferase
MTARSKVGNYVAGTFDGRGRVGACLGFVAPPDNRSMHSHIAGVAAPARGRSVRFALKVHGPAPDVALAARARARVRGVARGAFRTEAA